MPVNAKNNDVYGRVDLALYMRDFVLNAETTPTRESVLRFADNANAPKPQPK